MRLIRSAVLLCSFLATAALAANIEITQFPSGGIQPGVPTTIEWSGGDGVSTITIILVQGTVANHQNISTILQRNAQATSFTWTPGALPDGDNYLLEIVQGSETSYTAPFSIGAATPGSVTTVPASATSTQIIVPPLSPNPVSPIPVPLTTASASASASSSSAPIVPPLSPVSINPGGPISTGTSPASTTTVVFSVTSAIANSTTVTAASRTSSGTTTSTSVSSTSGAVGLTSSFALVVAALFSVFILA
ncbi:MAG: hypothetical protein MMC33_000053 [Icmadophila ericetorum]|nr:hypothetical protein [Icmadophila ericetorum]